MLSRLPSGVSVFLDANVFLFHFWDLNLSCTELLWRIARQEIRAYTSTIVLTEVMHQLMLSEIGERHAVSPGGALRFLRQHPEIIPSLRKSADLMRQLSNWRVRVLPLQRRDIALAIELSQRHRLMTIDAAILATMHRRRLTHLVSNDTDFAHVPDITLWRP